MNTVFPQLIRKLGAKKLVFLFLLGLVTLAYIASPLIALACPGGNGGNDGNNPVVTVTVAQSIRIDGGILYAINQQKFLKRNINFLQIVGPNNKSITLTQYQQLLQYAATPKISPVKVRVALTLLNNVTLFTQGQFITRVLGNKPFGTIIVTTDNKQQQLIAIAQQFITTLTPNLSSNSPILLRVPSSTTPN